MKKLLLLTILLANPVYAATGTGEMSATIISTRDMSPEEMREFCEENPETVQCEELIIEQEDEETGETYEVPLYQMDFE